MTEIEENTSEQAKETDLEMTERFQKLVQEASQWGLKECTKLNMNYVTFMMGVQNGIILYTAFLQKEDANFDNQMESLFGQMNDLINEQEKK